MNDENNYLSHIRIQMDYVKLNVPIDCYCVVKCGAIWARTLSMEAAERNLIKWEMKIPIYDPSTFLIIGVFNDATRKTWKVVNSN